ncbi:hypothetical protein F5880DRAFT_1494200, partial [Lentinula raphanica]
MEGLGRRGSNFLLKTIRLFGYSLAYLQPGGPNYQQQVALSSISEDIRGLEKKFNLDADTTVFAVCPRCNCTYKPLPLPLSSIPCYPSKCSFRSTTNAEPCNENLLSGGQPIKTFEFYSFLDWFGRFLALPGIGKYSEAFCEQINAEGPPMDKENTADGRFYYELRGPDGKLFVQERGSEGRWFFKLHSDFFNIEGNKIGGKHLSTGVISMTCLNLPPEMREDSAYVYLAGIISGPSEPDSKEAEHSHFIRPLVDELLIAYER